MNIDVRHSLRFPVKQYFCGLLLLIGAWPSTGVAGDAIPGDGKPKVHIFATGGTISGVAPERIMLSGYKAGSLKIEEMLADVPEIHDVADLTWEQVSNVGSGNIDTSILLTLAKRINALYAERPDVHGVVVTHGTGTIEETAYFLNLTVI